MVAVGFGVIIVNHLLLNRWCYRYDSHYIKEKQLVMDMYDLLNWMETGKTKEFYYLLNNYVENLK